jgi:hypothetical protein
MSPSDPDPTSGDTYNVTSHGQQGGVTAGQYINQAPTPQVRYQVLSKDEAKDGQFVTTLLLNISAAYAVERLEAIALGAGVVDAQLTPNGGGVMANVISGAVLVDVDGRAAACDRPGGQMRFLVTTTEPGSIVDLRFRLR